MIDISDEMAAHEALRAREPLLDRLAEALPTGAIQVTPTGPCSAPTSASARLVARADAARYESKDGRAGRPVVHRASAPAV